jgi:hypothetical protein
MGEYIKAEWGSDIDVHLGVSQPDLVKRIV